MESSLGNNCSNSFGHLHILNIMTLIQAQRTCIDNTYLNIQRQISSSLITSGVEMFKKSAMLIDTQGNTISNTNINVSNIKSLMHMFIDGVSTINGIIDANNLIAILEVYVNGVTDKDGKLILRSIINKMSTFLNSNSLISWLHIITEYQECVLDLFYAYRMLWCSKPNTCEYNRLFQLADAQFKHFMGMGNKLGAFFVGFYYLIVFLDSWFTITFNLSSTHNKKLDHFPERLMKCWHEHVEMINDYCRTMAANFCESTVEKITNATISLITSCGSLDIIIAEVFRILDELIIHRELYKVVSGLSDDTTLCEYRSSNNDYNLNSSNYNLDTNTTSDFSKVADEYSKITINTGSFTLVEREKK